MSFPVLGFEMRVEECVSAVEELVGEMIEGAGGKADASCTASVQGVLQVVMHGLGVFASNSEGESAGRMTQQAIRIVPQTPATTIPDTAPETLPAVADPEPLPVTGNDDDLVTWSLLLIAFGALSVLYVRRTRLN